MASDDAFPRWNRQNSACLFRFVPQRSKPHPKQSKLRKANRTFDRVVSAETESLRSICFPMHVRPRLTSGLLGSDVCCCRKALLSLYLLCASVPVRDIAKKAERNLCQKLLPGAQEISPVCVISNDSRERAGGVTTHRATFFVRVFFSVT